MSDNLQNVCEQPRQKVLQITLLENELMTNSEWISLSGGEEKRLKFHITYDFVLAFVFEERCSRN